MRAPRLARLLIRLFTPADRREDVLGDLEETYRRHAEAGAARAWLAAHADALLIAGAMRWQAMSRPAPAALRHAVSGTDLKLGLRLMYRQPVLTATAVVSLTVGIAVATVGFALWKPRSTADCRLPAEIAS